ncbi:MAG: HEAT repeat domain-containing protein [Gammaproteobacteria bacterium]|nr:HEAT repeat domain-containing protein [Gammaproteobacteria bacterium]
MKRIILIGIIMLTITSWAADIVDLYGLEDERASLIVQQYQTKIQRLETTLMTEVISASRGKPHPHLYRQLVAQKKRVIANIKRRHHLAFVDIQTVAYPKNKDIYSTIEIIETPKSPRMRFVATPVRIENRQHDLVTEMMQFESLATRLMLTKQLDLNADACPVYHCMVPYQHPQLAPYLRKFQQGVIQEKQAILHTIKQDPNPERRAAAAFLIGHLTRPQEIIHLLSPHVDDPDADVRNNVMRVMASTLRQSHLQTVDPAPFIALLNSPFVSDRNKSLHILYSLADSAKNQHTILQTGGQYLLRLLKLSQPNNHDITYLLLKKISHQNFGDQQFSQWQAWIASAQNPKNENRSS